jgi:hypothetical protein
MLLDVRQSVVQRIVEATRREVPYETVDEFEFKVLSEYAKVADPFATGGGRLVLGEIDDEHLYWMCFYLSDNLALRRSFEFKLWRRFRREWADFNAWRGMLLGEVERRIIEDGRAETRRASGAAPASEKEYIDFVRRECRQVVDDTPLFFVSATKIPPTIRDVVLRNRVKEAPIRFYNERRETWVAAEPIERYGPSSYHIRLSGPASLGDEARLVIQRIWNEEVTSWGWIEPRLLQEGAA